jgi:hypothetical protein
MEIRFIQGASRIIRLDMIGIGAAVLLAGVLRVNRVNRRFADII